MNSISWLSDRRLAFLAAIGSVASISALIIVLLDKVADSAGIDPQLTGWRFIFILISLLGLSSTVIYTYMWVKTAYLEAGLPDHVKFGKIVFRGTIGLLILGVFLDALFAALYWNAWFWGLFSLIKWFFALNFS